MNVTTTQPQPAVAGGQPVQNQPQPLHQNVSGGAPGAGFAGAGVYGGGHMVLVGGPASTSFNRDPVSIKCPHCAADISTETNLKIGQAVYCCSVVCIVMCCWLGCCLIPCCTDSYKDVEHSCPNCKAHIGTCPGNTGTRVHAA